MKKSYSLKIDAYSHISPPKYTEFIRKKYPVMYDNMLGGCVPLYNMDERFKIMDMYEGLVQVLTIGPVPPIETDDSRLHAIAAHPVVNTITSFLISSLINVK